MKNCIKNRRALLLPFLFLLQALFLAFYLGQEKMIPFWDMAMYQHLVVSLFNLTPAEAAWRFFANSFTQNYNLLFAAPSLLTFSLFGASRLVFIETNFFFFAVPCQIAFGLILAQLFNISKRRGLLAAVLGCSILPFFWVPLLVGFPDMAALACLSFAFLFALTPKRNWKNALAVGALLALAVLFRRPFAYSALAFLLALGSLDLFRLIKKQVLLKTLALFYVPCAAALLGLLLLVEPAYFKVMLGTNFITLYRPYDQGAATFALFVLSRLGLGVLALSLGGYFFLWRKEKRFSFPVLFLLLFSGFWFLLWAFGPAQLDEHYLLPALPLFCLVGISGLMAYLWQANIAKKIMLGGLCVFLFGNASYALFFSKNISFSSDAPKVSFLSSPRPPWIRKDYDTLFDMASYIGSLFQKHDKGVLVSSSYILNLDLLRAIYEDKMNRPSIFRRFLPTPEIDGIQPPPSESYAAGTLFIVAEPAQYHVNPKGQKIFTALKDQFPPSEMFSTFFEKLPRTFTLDRDVKVSIWRKKEMPPLLLHEALAAMEEKAGQGEKWVSKRRAEARLYAPASSTAAHVRLHFSDTRNTAEILFDDLLSAGTYRLGFRFEHQPVCMQPQLTLRFYAPAGTLVHEEKKSLPQIKGKNFTAFSIPPDQKGVFFLSLELKVKAYGSCSATFYDLEIDKVNERNQYEPLLLHAP